MLQREETSVGSRTLRVGGGYLVKRLFFFLNCLIFEEELGEKSVFIVRWKWLMDFENTDNFSFFPYLDFEKRGKKEVCPVLDQFLCHVAKTGETM